MPAGAFVFFARNLADLRLNDLPSATVKIALLSSSYTPSAGEAGHHVWSDVSGNEIANGNGYSSGGITLSSTNVTSRTNGWKFSSANPQWSSSGSGIPAWRYAVMYVSGTLWGKSSPLIGYFLGDAAPADVALTPSGGTLTLTMPAADGWFDITRG